MMRKTLFLPSEDVSPSMGWMVGGWMKQTGKEKINVGQKPVFLLARSCKKMFVGLFFHNINIIM